MKFLVLDSASVALVVAVLVLNPDHQWRWSLWRSPVADLVVRNAKIYTSDESLPFADSMAVRNGRVLRLGNYSSVQDMVRYQTKEFDLMGKIVVPGFIDSHVHLIFGGLQMGRVELRGISQKDEFLMRVKEAVRNAKQGSWILGGGWNNDFWGGELPAASWIDDITPYNPFGYQGWMVIWAWLIQWHFKLAGITNSSEDPIGGTIMKTSSGASPSVHSRGVSRGAEGSYA